MRLTVAEVRQRSSIDLPLDDFLLPGGRVDLHPEVQEKQYLQVRLKGNLLTLVAGKYIGVIPLNDKYAIRVLPIVDVPNLMKILVIARREPFILNTLERSYQTSKNTADIFEMLMHALQREVRVLELYGMHREYIRRTREGSDFRGKIMFRETMVRQWSKGLYHRATMEYFDYSRDNIINRAIHYTLWYVLRNHQLLTTKSDNAIVAELSQALSAFEGIPIDHSRSFLPHLRALVLGKQLPPSRAYLSRLLQICLMLLEELGLDLDGLVVDDGVILPPLVIDMEKVFEKFLVNTVKGSLAGEVKCWDTNEEHQYRLFRKPLKPTPLGISLAVNEQLKAEPDFVLSKGGKPLVVCDAKFTLDEKRGQDYQIVAHALAYGTKDAVLIYPDDQNAPKGCQCLGNIGDVRLFSYHFPLNAADLRSASDELTKTLLQIANDV